MANILITGGTGSLGQALVARLLCEASTTRLVIFSRDELKQHEMRLKWTDEGDSVVRYFLGDVRDKERLRRAFRGVDTVIHAAALKQVPALEYSPFEAVQTNIIGAKNVIDAALDWGVKKVMAISTDKSCQPTNLYGATKLVMEKLMTQANSYSGSSGTHFSCVRYGNVVNSRGSVVPVWREQAKTGRLSLTSDEMTRYLITLRQAVDFVLSSLALMHGGEIFVPKIPSMRMADLACLIGGPDSSIFITGIRPGEKLAETLISVDESPRTIDLGDRYVILPAHPWWSQEHYSRATKMPEGWCYRSDTNERFLTAEEAMAMIGDE